MPQSFHLALLIHAHAGVLLGGLEQVSVNPQLVNPGPVVGAVLVALGNPEGPWLILLFAIVVFVVVVSIGKDVVDNDIDTLDKDTPAVIPASPPRAP